MRGRSQDPGRGTRLDRGGYSLGGSGRIGGRRPRAPPQPDTTTVTGEASPWQLRLRALGVITENDGSVDGIAGRI